jgi:NADPH2:quinone reductase
MHAIVLHDFGPPESLVLEEVLDPAPTSGQVLIEVVAAGVHLIDTAIRAGRPMGPFPLPALPTIPGREVAGVVRAVGEDVDAGWIGRFVVTHLGEASGGYAELAVRDVAAVHALPVGADPEAAVAMIGTGRTAMAILGVAELVPTDVVVVLAAAGGLGSLLVQAARAAGATVVGVAGGPEKVARVAGLGADVAVDYLEPAWPAAARAALGDRAATVVLDGVGGAARDAALELLGPGGRHVSFGASSGAWTPAPEGVASSTALGPEVIARLGGQRALEERALAALAAGELAPVLTRFPLARAAGAHAALEGRRTVGKVVLVP